jgi:hypothetical protein
MLEGRKNNSGKTHIEMLKDAKNDLRELTVKRWRKQPNTTEKWASAEMEAKVLSGT